MLSLFVIVVGGGFFFFYFFHLESHHCVTIAKRKIFTAEAGFGFWDFSSTQKENKVE